MMNKITLVAGCSVVSATIVPSLLQAHGYTTYPPARQLVCEQDGGYNWPKDGSKIPNAACRAAFHESGAYPFDQLNEYSKNVIDYKNIEAIKAAINDGSVCSGGDANKSGVSVASGEWQRTTMTAGEEFTLKFRATAAHNPSFWQVYLSDVGYDATSTRLDWADLTLLTSYDNLKKVVVDGENFYTFSVTLPIDRVGDAVLLTRWQRDDAAGEGFYNCSDITLLDKSSTPPWAERGRYLSNDLKTASGDSLWFRVFNSSGKEIIFEQFLIDHTNSDQQVWAEQLSRQINHRYPGVVQIGVENTDGVIEYDTTDVYANKVYVSEHATSYVLTVKKTTADTPAELIVTGIQGVYTLAHGQASIMTDVSSTGRYAVTMRLFDMEGMIVDDNNALIDMSMSQLAVTVTQAGSYIVDIMATSELGSTPAIQRFTVVVRDETAVGTGYDYIYPQFIEKYVAGTVVMTANDKRYECRPFPNEGWCRAYSESANQYEPGVGFDWEAAWIGLQPE